METCRTCKYWEQYTNHSCHRHAPNGRVNESFGGRLDPVWPATYAEDYCGDWEIKNTQDCKCDEYRAWCPVHGVYDKEDL